MKLSNKEFINTYFEIKLLMIYNCLLTEIGFTIFVVKKFSINKYYNDDFLTYKILQNQLTT